MKQPYTTMQNKIIILIVVALSSIQSHSQYCLQDNSLTTENLYCGDEYSDVYLTLISDRAGQNPYDVNYNLPVDNNGNILLSTIYNSPQLNTNMTANGELTVYIYYFRWNSWEAFWNDNGRERICIRPITIQGDSHLSINLPDNICQGESIDLNDYVNKLGGSFTGSHLSGGAGNILTIPDNEAPSSITYDWTVNVGACTFTKTDVITIKPKPTLSWTGNIQTGTILSSDPQIDLAPFVSTNGTLTIQGDYIFNNSYYPDRNWLGQTSDVNAIATNSFGCRDTITQQVTVTVDAGTPRTPAVFHFNSEGYRFVDILDPYALESVFDLCDGQTFNFKIRNGSGGSLNGIDSVRYYYYHNGIIDTIGKFHRNTFVGYTIPQTGLTREDYISASYISNIGIEGAKLYCTVKVNTTTPNENTTNCVDGNEVIGVNYNTFGINELSVALNFYDTDTTIGVSIKNSLYSNGAIDTIQMEATRNYVWRDINNNILDTTYNFNFTSNGTKATILIREEFTKLPMLLNDSVYLFHNYQSQTCRKYDTITVVLNPIVGFTYSGDSTIIGGTTVTVDDNSLLADYTTFNFFNTKDEQQGQSITDTLYSGQGIVKITAYDNYGCKDDTLFDLVTVTNNPSVGLLDEQSSGIVYPVRNNIIAYSGSTDTIDSEFHVCDGQTIDFQIDINRLAFSNGIDSVRYFYYSNGIIDTIGKYGINENVSYTIPKANNKRVDSIYTQLFTLLDLSGSVLPSPVHVSIPLQRTIDSTLNCDIVLNYASFIGQNQTDYNGLNVWSYNGFNADVTTFQTEFKDVNGNILFNNGASFNYVLPNNVKVDSVFKKETTLLPFRSNGGNDYYNTIVNPQVCELIDTIIIVKPPVANFTFQSANLVTFGTPVRHISNSLFNDFVEWDFMDGAPLFDGDTVWHVMYEIGDHDLRVVASDIYGCSDTLYDYGYIQVMDWTGIEENANIQIQTLGNPFKNSIELNVELSSNEEVNITVVDLNGKVVYSNYQTLSLGKNRISIDANNFATGSYVLTVKGQQSKKVLTTKLNKIR